MTATSAPALQTEHDGEGTRVRTITWSDPARTRFRLRGRDGLAQLEAVVRGDAPPPPAAALLGLRLERVERGRVVFSLVADEMHENPMGTMHGGVVATLVDSAMGCAVQSTLPADTGFTTLELKTNFVRPIVQTTGRVRAEARVVHRGDRVVTTEAQVLDDHDMLYAHATATCLVTRRSPSRAGPEVVR